MQSQPMVTGCSALQQAVLTIFCLRAIGCGVDNSFRALARRPPGIAKMSFGFGVGDFLAVIKLVKKIRTDFADAPKQFEHISTEVRSLAIVLQDIEIFVSSDHVSDTQKQDLATILAGCDRTLRDTEKALDKYCDLGNQRQSIAQAARRAWKRLTFEPDDIRQLRSRISSHVTLLSSLVGGVTRDNVAKIVKRQDQQAHEEVLDWITPIDYAAQQSDFINRRQAGTGQWLLDSSEYQNWIAFAKEPLFCPGIPGAGKTILASVVVNDLLERFPPDGSTAICYIYCNFRRTGEQKLNDLLGSLLRQLTQGQIPFPRSVLELYERHKDRRTRPSIEEIRTTLHSVTASCSRVFVVVDALDECDVSNSCRQAFISELLHLQTQSMVNLLATSRFIPEITERFSQSMNMEIRATMDDIDCYLKGCMLSLPSFVSSNIDLQEKIKEKIINSADGMFLLAKLHLDSLRGKRSPKAIRSALEGLATGSDAYDAAYTDAMYRIKGQLPEQEQLAFQALSWIACAKRPLKTVELLHALGTEPEESAFDEENIPDIREVLANCCGLVTVDEQTGIVRLVHYTTQEYFERTQNKWLPDCQAYLTEVCVTYLSFSVFKAGRCESDQDFKNRLNTYQLYDYASHYWGEHAKFATSYEWTSSFLEIQSQVDSVVQVFLEEEASYYLPYSTTEISIHMTGLHLVAMFGIQKAVVYSLQFHDHDGKDSFDRTPLSYAAGNGNEDVVRLLLEHKAAVDSKCVNDRTPLSFATENGYEAMVRLLLEHKADADSKDEDGRLVNPLIYESTVSLESQD
ncbi:hypothetical protein Micbo1qcDRAFT_198942 [Microdochium bolleyi]|uniref:Uncharacterized protein n=1 Tax=Microdochium bolleyi TaxID=196109 RepID=A0A136IJG8_9PEZI|nr:hypothetical protein Micbo1qcDRAFT_198942 [Microdochium bolleyi]